MNRTEGTEGFTGAEFRLAHALTHGPVLDIHRALRDSTVNPNHLPNCFWSASTPNAGNNYIDAVSTFLWTDSDYSDEEGYNALYWSELFEALMQRRPIVTGPELAQTVLDLDLFATRPIWFYYLVRQGFSVDSRVVYQGVQVTLAYYLLAQFYYDTLRDPAISDTIRGQTRITALLVARISDDPLVKRVFQPIDYEAENPRFFQSLDYRFYFLNAEFQQIAPQGVAMATRFFPNREPLPRFGEETVLHHSLNRQGIHSLQECQAASVAAVGYKETIHDYLRWFFAAITDSEQTVQYLPDMDALPAPWLIEVQPDRRYSTFLRLVLCNASIWSEKDTESHEQADRWYLTVVEFFTSQGTSSTYQEESTSSNPALETSPLLDRISRLGRASVLHIPRTVEHVMTLDLWLQDPMPEPAFAGLGTVPFFVYLVTEVFVSIVPASPKKRSPLAKRSKRPRYKVQWVDWHSIYAVFHAVSDEDWDAALLNRTYPSVTRAKIRVINQHVQRGRMPGGGRLLHSASNSSRNCS